MYTYTYILHSITSVRCPQKNVFIIYHCFMINNYYYYYYYRLIDKKSKRYLLLMCFSSFALNLLKFQNNKIFPFETYSNILLIITLENEENQRICGSSENKHMYKYIFYELSIIYFINLVVSSYFQIIGMSTAMYHCITLLFFFFLVK